MTDEGEVAFSEYAQFAGRVLLFVGIVIGSYWFVTTESGRSERKRGSG